MVNDLDFAIYFNSGTNSRSNTYINGANITHIQVNNSDQSYYQDGTIELYDCSTQQVGDTVDVYINNSLEFSGYVSRRQIQHKAGKHVYSYQMIGKTYDLWRYRTSKDTSYTGYSTFIASSLIHDFCTNINGNSNITTGWNFENAVDLSDQTVGDALVTLTNYDGFKFYVDNSGKLIYYDPDDEPEQYVYVSEDGVGVSHELLDMSPIEEADEDLSNDVLVIGGSAYAEKTNIPLPTGKPIAQVSSGIFKRHFLVAQRVKAKDDTLSALRMFLNRSAEPNTPANNVSFEVWDNTTQEMINDSFDQGMKNWSVTSNTMFEDGDLQLSYCGFDLNQTTYNLGSSYYYFGQTFRPTMTTIIDSATMRQFQSILDTMTVFVEIRDTNLGLPTTTILCSGSFILSKSLWHTTPINLNPKVTLTAGNQYAIVTHSDPLRYELVRGINSTDIVDGCCSYSPDGTTWSYFYTSAQRDATYYIKLRGFSKSGYALSKPFGTPIRKLFNRYMKVDIDGVTSSQRVYISGSNSGSKHWHTLTDGGWYDFGTENIGGFSSQVKIWLSGNGTYTPKVGSVIVTVADTTGGPESTLFTDTFNDCHTYLSGLTRIHISTSTGELKMSGNNGESENVSFFPVAPYTLVDGSPYDLFPLSANIVGSGEPEPSYAPFIYSDTSTHNYSARFDMPSLIPKKCIYRLLFSGKSYDSTYKFSITNIYVSGNFSGKGWILATNPNYTFSTTYENYDVDFTNNCYYYNIKRLLVSGTFRTKTSYRPYLENLDIREAPYTTISGTIQTKDFNVGNPIIYLKVAPISEVWPNKITYSGSKNSGSTWYKLTKNTWTTLGNGGASGQHIKLMYNMKPSTLSVASPISSVSLKGASPEIGSATLYYSGILGGGLPKSGTKIEHSDELSLAWNDIAYPPSYSSYQSYESPKLMNDGGEGFNTNNYYWIVMKAYSGATTAQEYWKYYYDWNSTYTDGNIAYSTGNANLGTTGVGVVWKTHDLVPTWVPMGSLIMDIGWKDEQVRATATNEQSINLFGRHQKIINDSTIDSYVLASSMANEMVYGSDVIPRKGNLTIDGVTGIKTNYKISSSLTNLGIGGIWEIVAFSQILDSQGFRTVLTYGKNSYDVTKEINEIKKRIGI